jgi:glycine/D-amino acid oxidase-like deaminating enzyme
MVTTGVSRAQIRPAAPDERGIPGALIRAGWLEVGTAEQRGAGVRDAKITIVGGGAVGCAVAYVLSRAGYADIQVIEQGELAGATSGQAAGLVGQVRATRERCRLAMASVATYSRIEQETGFTADWRQTGSVRIAMTGERAVEFRELAGVARSAGLEVEFLTPARLAELCPVLEGARAGITRTTTACPAQPIRSAGSHRCGPALRAGGDDQQRPGTAGRWDFPSHGQRFNPHRYENICTGAYVPAAP